jgi:hypothetical protein
MRNGLKRGEISKKLGGVLCFEMEVAGLMNTFPASCWLFVWEQILTDRKGKEAAAATVPD